MSRIRFFSLTLPYCFTFLSFVYMFKSSCTKRNSIMTSQIEVDVTFHPGLFSRVFKRVFETCFRMMVVLLVSLLLLPWRCCVDDHSIKSAGGASLVSKDVFSKNHLAMLEIWILIVYMYMYKDIHIYTLFLPQQKAWQLSLFNLDFWGTWAFCPSRRLKMVMYPSRLNPDFFLRRDHCVSSLSPSIRNGVSKNRDTPKWMVYNGKPY